MVLKFWQGKDILYRVSNLKVPGGQGTLPLQLSLCFFSSREAAGNPGQPLAVCQGAQAVSWLRKGWISTAILQSRIMARAPWWQHLPGSAYAAVLQVPLRLCSIRIPPPPPGFAQFSGTEQVPKRPARPPHPVTHFPCSRSCFRRWPLREKPNPEEIQGWVPRNRHAQTFKI